jgi:hypothetical protein
LESPPHALIARAIPFDLSLPVSLVRGGFSAFVLAAMAVPKAPMHVDDLAKAGQDDVWRSRQVPAT